MSNEIKVGVLKTQQELFDNKNIWYSQDKKFFLVFNDRLEVMGNLSIEGFNAFDDEGLVIYKSDEIKERIRKHVRGSIEADAEKGSDPEESVTDSILVGIFDKDRTSLSMPDSYDKKRIFYSMKHDSFLVIGRDRKDPIFFDMKQFKKFYDANVIGFMNSDVKAFINKKKMNQAK